MVQPGRGPSTCGVFSDLRKYHRFRSNHKRKCFVDLTKTFSTRAQKKWAVPITTKRTKLNARLAHGGNLQEKEKAGQLRPAPPHITSDPPRVVRN